MSRETVRDRVLQVLETSEEWLTVQDMAAKADVGPHSARLALRYFERHGKAARMVTAFRGGVTHWGRQPESRKRVRVRLEFVVQLDEEGGGLPIVLGDGPVIGQTTRAARAALNVLGLTGGAIETGARHRFEVLKPTAKRGGQR